jgi:sec-independent protein translocase protein TatC
MLIKMAGVLGVMMGICFFETKEILLILQWPMVRAGLDPKEYMQVLGIIDPFNIQIDIALAGGVVMSLPALLYFFGEFLLPALTPREKRFLLPTFSVGAVLFIVGVLFCYFMLLPTTLQFFKEYNDYFGFRTQWTMQNYIDFATQMLLAFGLCFELPLVIVILNIFGIVSHEALAGHRRHAAVIILIAAACITPGSDLYSLLALSLPMYFLYEASLWVTWWQERKRPKTELME